MDEMYLATAPTGAAAGGGRSADHAVPNAPRVVLLGDDDATLAQVERRILETIVDAVVESLPAEVVLRSVAADCVVLDHRVGSRSGPDVLRSLRAGGFTGGVVLLAGAQEPDAVGADAIAARRFGAEGPVAGAGGGVGDAVRRALESAARHDAAGRETQRTRQLVAAGELALVLQHAINNPLTALMAEAQLLEMELSDGEHQAAARRIVDLCRRTIAVARQLDDVAPLI